MSNKRRIYKLTFHYRSHALLTIVFNLLFVIFNLLSIILFIPFLQLIFKKGLGVSVPKPEMGDGFFSFLPYAKDYYNYTMQEMVRSNPENALIFVCVSVFLAFFFKNICRYIAIYYQSFLRHAVVRDLADQLYQKSLRLPLSYYTDQRKGDLMARINNDTREIELGVIALLELIFREPFAIVTSVIGLIWISPKLTLISFILLPISAFVISRIGKSLKRTVKQHKEQYSIILSFLDETLNGIRVIKSFNAGEFIAARFHKHNLRYQQLSTKSMRKSDLSPPLNEVLGAAVMLGLVWFGGLMILKQGDSVLTGEEFITFIIIFSQLLRPIQNIATSMTNLNRAEPSMQRIQEVLETDEVIHDSAYPNSFEELYSEIEFKDVWFKYKDDWVLKGISFKLRKGKTIAIVGESGSGKSTIADLLPRFYDVDKGEILLNGKNVKEILLEDLHRNIGIVSQESVLFNDSVYNNIVFGEINVTSQDVQSAAKVAHADHFIQELPDGYDSNIGERGNKLSGGQKQRISIARAVLKNPSILILDEATSALDTESERIVQSTLDGLMKERTSLIIAHRLSTIIQADEIIVLSKGEIVERGTHTELLNRKQVYFKLCALQGITN